jgi:NAD-dependent DNA ligase
VFSGFRDKTYKEKLEAQGHSVQDALTKDTDYLVVKDNSKLSSKMKKAKELGITIINFHY